MNDKLKKCFTEAIDILIDEEDKDKVYEDFETVHTKQDGKDAVVWRIKVVKRRKTIK